MRVKVYSQLASSQMTVDTAASSIEEMLDSADQLKQKNSTQS